MEDNPGLIHFMGLQGALYPLKKKMLPSESPLIGEGGIKIFSGRVP